MSKTFKVGGTVTIYFGDSMRSFLKKSLRKKNTFFVDHIIIAIDGDILTVFPNFRTDDKEVPYEVSGLRIDKSDRHILAEGELMYLSELNKSELMVFAEEHKYNPKEFKEAMKPFRKAHKKDDWINDQSLTAERISTVIRKATEIELAGTVKVCPVIRIAPADCKVIIKEIFFKIRW